MAGPAKALRAGVSQFGGPGVLRLEECADLVVIDLNPDGMKAPGSSR
jgi:hypothetical protein